MLTTRSVHRDCCILQAMDAGAYNFAIAFQERIKISEEKMEFYEVRLDGIEHRTMIHSWGENSNPQLLSHTRRYAPLLMEGQHLFG